MVKVWNSFLCSNIEWSPTCTLSKNSKMKLICVKKKDISVYICVCVCLVCASNLSSASRYQFSNLLCPDVCFGRLTCMVYSTELSCPLVSYWPQQIKKTEKRLEGGRRGNPVSLLPHLKWHPLIDHNGLVVEIYDNLSNSHI